MNPMKSDQKKLHKAINAGFEIQAAEFQSLERKCFFRKKFFGILNFDTAQIRVRAEEKMKEKEIYVNVSDQNDTRKFLIVSVEKNNINDYVVHVRDKEYRVKCFLVNVQII